MSIKAGVNLSSVQHDLSKDFFGTLERVAEAGYKNIEMIGYNLRNYSRYMDEIPVELFRDKLQELGLSLVSSQESGRSDMSIDSHDWESVCAYYDKLDCHSIVIPSIWMKDREDALRIAEQMNRAGKMMHENGFNFYFHNHAHEFIKDGEKTLYEYIIDNTDPAYVRFELDLGWVIRAGLKPVEILNKLGKRCDIVHLKDISHNPKFPINIFQALKQDSCKEFDGFRIYGSHTSPEDYADLGTGSYDFTELYELIHKLGSVRYAIVENIGASTDKFKSIASDLNVVMKHIQK
jgi:sugar phosphate isomerase/epimerase